MKSTYTQSDFIAEYTLHDERDHEAAVDVDAPRVGVLHATMAAKVDDLQQRVHELLGLHAQAARELVVMHDEQPQRPRSKRCTCANNKRRSNNEHHKDSTETNQRALVTPSQAQHLDDKRYSSRCAARGPRR